MGRSPAHSGLRSVLTPMISVGNQRALNLEGQTKEAVEVVGSTEADASSKGNHHK